MKIIIAIYTILFITVPYAVGHAVVPVENIFLQWGVGFAVTAIVLGIVSIFAIGIAEIRDYCNERWR